MKKINIITLGCSKNIVDSEYLSAQFAANGYQVIFDSNDTTAKIVIINTCGFIAAAKEESINMIMQFVEAKRRGQIEQLFVFGCLAERYANELRAEIPEVDSFFGVKNLKDILAATGMKYKNSLIGERCISTPRHYAYLKIAEGCNWTCSYCAIPLIRGKYESVKIEKIIDEAQFLAQHGTKELLIIAQDTTYYGLDIYKKQKLAELLNRLSEIEGIEWIRLHYAYPSNFPNDVITEIATNPKICKYIDIPFQHINNDVLKKMRRGSNAEIYKLIDKLRTQIPDIALRTTLLTGHPGEDENAFEELKNFVNDMKFERLGVFPYSEEDGTFSAKNFTDDIPETVKNNRVDEIMKIQNSLSKQMNLRKAGKEYRVIVDSIENDYIIARTEYDSPEIDNEVLISISSIPKNKIPQVGEFVNVKITSAEDYDLFGEIILNDI
ncbi:MAG: 30S ribosomal protein S12 methylthiotransferase RimO [Prevotellaceae bacterium]|nr:30S ribosomal protein S12 methylthiotransferase RimO [Prevotellaceae bacterium]